MTDLDDNDAYLSNDGGDDSQYAGNLGITDAVDLDPKSVLPFGEATANLYTGISEGEWSDIYAGAADLVGNAVSFAIDPLNWLISAGLTFLIDFVQPLEDLLSLVTGNAERIEAYAQKWQELGAALVPLGAATLQAATDQLIEWQGKDADAAKALLTEFSEAIKATGGEAASIAGLLTLFSKIMAAAQQIIIGIMATLIEWMIIEWVAAMALAAPTMGGSVAAAGAATAVQATAATSRAVRIVDQVITLLNKIGALLGKLLPGALKTNVGSSVIEFSAASATLSTGVRIATSVLADWRGYAGPFVNVSTGGIKNEQAGDPQMSDTEIDEALDTNR
ncbi:hypothetical protein JOD64_003792 [Micromonospora luteifusca]|uniref:PPE family protein n=1 Tax=Micromonospora luteifusca TaxID=709860 RepID=A0ABS2LWM0_9ACTN|nr:hypothetical protein [Micromonospora luteifusca]MBM7492570.1 hypothetical protein [Micromonospora luteifusca]